LYRNGNYWTQVLAPFSSIVDGGRPASTSTSYQLAAFDRAGNRSARGSIVTAATPSCAPTTVEMLRKRGSLTGYTDVRNFAIDETGGLAVIPVWNVGVRIVLLDSSGLRVVSTLLPGDRLTNSVKAAGGYAYLLQAVAGTRFADLTVLDVRQPSAPRVASRLRLPGENNGGGLALDDGKVFVASDNRLQVIDVRIPESPRVIGSGSFDVPNPYVDKIVAANGWVYASGGAEASWSFDVHASAQPVFAKHYYYGVDWMDVHRGLLYTSYGGKIPVSSIASDGLHELTRNALSQVVAGAFAGDRGYLATWDSYLAGGRLLVVGVAGGGKLDVIAIPPISSRIELLDASDSGIVVTIDEAGMLTVYQAQ
jgi:hypothetical protein